VDPPATREALLQVWEDGWGHVFRALEALSEEDLARTVTIRGEAHSVMQAINRQMAHYALHIGQIVMLAKHFAGDRWQSLSIPRNRSAEFNRRVGAGRVVRDKVRGGWLLAASGLVVGRSAYRTPWDKHVVEQVHKFLERPWSPPIGIRSWPARPVKA